MTKNIACDRRHFSINTAIQISLASQFQHDTTGDAEYSKSKSGL
jgi:hypothetical protein